MGGIGFSKMGRQEKIVMEDSNSAAPIWVNLARRKWIKIEKAESTRPNRPTHFIFDFIFSSPFIEKWEKTSHCFSLSLEKRNWEEKKEVWNSQNEKSSGIEKARVKACFLLSSYTVHKQGCFVCSSWISFTIFFSFSFYFFLFRICFAFFLFLPTTFSSFMDMERDPAPLSS